MNPILVFHVLPYLSNAPGSIQQSYIDIYFRMSLCLRLLNDLKLINDNKNQDLQKIEGQNFHKKIELKKFGDIENNTISLQKNELNRFGFVKSAVGGNRN